MTAAAVPLQILYGARGAFADVTSSVAGRAAVRIPASDPERALMFGDPAVGVLKQVIVRDEAGDTRAFPHDVAARLERDAAGRLVFVPAPEDTLREIHARLDIAGGSVLDEYPEQLMAATYIPAAACVLELGGNIGRNSCVIASVLEDPTRLVVMESDPRTAKKLVRNRDRNGFAFHVEAAALSRRPLQQRGWETKPVEGEVDEGWARAPTISWDNLQRKYGMTFDTLVADCEGALYHILRDEPGVLATIRLVIIENDFEEFFHKEFCDAEFRRRGLERVFACPGGGGPCADRFYEVWRKPR